MERSTRKYGLINLWILIGATVAAFAVGGITNSLAGHVSAVFLGIGALVAAVSWFQMRLEENERLEKLEFDELTRSKGASTLFETKDTEGFPAQSAREQFEKFFVPVFTIVLFLVELAGAYFLWRWLSKTAIADSVKQPIAPIFIFAVFFLVLFILGRFSATISRLEDHRLLRPSGSWLLFN